MLLHDIADYAVREQTSRLSPEVIHHAKRAVVDWHAGAFPGGRIAPATLLEDAPAQDLVPGPARRAPRAPGAGVAAGPGVGGRPPLAAPARQRGRYARRMPSLT